MQKRVNVAKSADAAPGIKKSCALLVIPKKKKDISVNYKHDNEAMTTVDLVSGWVMVPLENVIQGRPIVKSYKMFGGTPFSPVKVNQKEIHKRPGTLEAIKRIVNI